MSIVVMKFGGTSVATPDLIKAAARKVARLQKNHDVVVVVSAMGHTTDQLFKMGHQITPNPKARELDMLLTAGERISVALLSIALDQMKLQSISFTGSQVGIITDTKHTDARIIEIRGDRVRNALNDGKIPVICGFQGVSGEKEITTLGRGGSDTTALALTAVLNAEKCIIYTDVDGVYTEDPNRFPGVQKIDKISYDEMLELSSRGAQVLHPRASGIAARHRVPVEIRNSFNNRKGTLITKLEGLEHPQPKAITHGDDLYLITLIQVLRRPRYLSQIVNELTDGGVHLKFFFHGVSEAKRFDLSFITPLVEKDIVKQILKKMITRLEINRIREAIDIVSISVIGHGIGSDSKVLNDTFNALAKAKAHVEAITTSELSLNIFLRKKYRDQAIKSLLNKFNLCKK
ncbi:hypothetical protein A2Y85_04555 [candidate division WOR-3 bacterium RBG_13_43_14]|uniref:Aspartokinase n=1 Tax=candidate division WOR-3 bacterium RBG_13_43_14 TaxID=1802590 RepID=A0A1F4UFP8_UNCW3|nr:MAG: hypothetical protein A2Y85_04555 [candidate division WOR-3 bacterium RBG_13_43_14]